jgi:hypothetical protein
MIHPNECRIGNKVQSPLVKGAIATINGILSNKGFIVDYTPTAENIYPIHLTPEILEACGFHSRPEQRHYIFFDNKILFEYWQLDGSIVIEGGFIGRKIKYLHQLQNLFFALTGIELEINTHELNNRVLNNL